MVPRVIARLALVLPVVALMSCEHNLGPPDALTAISVTRNPDTLVISTSRQFIATATYASGATAVIEPTWTLAASGGAISASGVFTAGTVAGTFVNTVTATEGSISGTASVTVLAGPAANIVVTPAPQTLATGGSQQFTAVVTDVAGNVLSILPNWSVAAGGGSTNSTGMFTAGTTAGTFPNTVVASVGSISGSATVIVTSGALATLTVTPNPRTLGTGAAAQFTAVGRDASGNVVPAAVTWAVVASGGSINSAGLFTAGPVAGTFDNTVRAQSGTVSGFATVVVTPGALASITVTPNPVAVATNASQQFTAVGRDGNGNVVTISPAPTWSVQPGNAGGTVSSSGLYTAPNAAGLDTVRATSGTIFGSARVNVVAAGPLVSIDVSPNPANVLTGATVQFTAVGFDANGLVVPTPGLSWSVVPAVGGGTIDAGTGLFTAGLVAGTFTNAIQATSGATSGFATVVVSAAPPPPPGPQPGPSLGAAETHGVLAGSTFTCVANGTIIADAGLWPGTANSGFPPCTITGQTSLGTPAAQQAQSDLTAAYLALEAMPCGTTITADLGGTTLAPGVYCSLSSVGVTGTVTLDGNGDPNALFVIRAPSTLTTAGNVLLQNGAQARNVYWWVGSSATLGLASQWQGNVIAFTSITLNTDAVLNGRALARNGAVTLGTNNTITLP